MIDSIKQVLDNIVLNHNGRELIHQCHPVIRTRPAVSQHIADFNRITVGDITNKRKQRLAMINSVLRP
jgi:hypothetical protein